MEEIIDSDKGFMVYDDILLLVKDTEQTVACHDASSYVYKVIHKQYEAGKCELFTEIRVTWPENEDISGTLDLAVEMEDAIHIFDYKFGRGVFVELEGNEQFLAYLYGFMCKLAAAKGRHVWDKKMFIHVVQPRLDNMHGMEVNKKDLMDFVDKALEACRLADAPNPPFKVSSKGCFWCKARPICKVAMGQTLLDAAKVFEAVMEINENRADQATILEVLDKSESLKAALKAVEEYAFLQLAKGESVPGYKLIQGNGNRVWKVDDDTLLDIMAENAPDLDLDDLMETKIKTPAKIEKLLTAELRKSDWFKDLYEQPKGKVSMVSETHKSPAYNPSSAEDVFKDIMDE